ncbi:hypothetical protein HanHA300_Chr06g0197441 [Helianthus annuus]|nr:hypothetical protein HanHA300_Chr06g0197441 [Helianthus annuus]KAJ0736582.1 hypothetical protein HanLR1_Chr06g0197521 [Helianthus annuus]KAJ0739526.1 hypothetical protein HanOQP8_Chr06g0206741 [Helianthus annuus]
MGFSRFCFFILFIIIIIFFFSNPTPVAAGDIVHDDKFAPKKPGCENDFVLI